MNTSIGMPRRQHPHLQDRPATSRWFILRGLTAVAVVTSLFLTTLGGPLRTAQATGGTWTQTVWTTPSTTLSAQPSGTNQFFRPTTAGFGVLTGTFGVCAGTGQWCQGPSDSAPGQTLRLAGNWRTDGGNPYSSDLNADGISELLFANLLIPGTTVFEGGWVYWGQGSGSSPSWSAAVSTTLPTSGASGVAVADLNGDGLPEIIFINYQNDSGYAANSVIYWGQPGGSHGVTYSASATTEMPTIGAHGAAVADLNKDGRPEIIFPSFTDGANFNLPGRIYWGQAGGPHGVTYDTSAATDLPTFSSISVAVADLNADGLPEIIFANYTADGMTQYYIDSYVYWGQPGGAYGVTYSSAARTGLPTYGSNNAAVADLNGDGRPELIFAGYTDGSSHDAETYVYWGQASGPYGVAYTTTARTRLPSVGAQKVSVAKVNSDDHLDVVVQNYHGASTNVFWGPLPLSGIATLSWTLPISTNFRSVTLSDLNADGRVDLLTARQGTNLGTNLWAGGRVGRVYFHTGNDSAPYDTAPSFSLPVQSPPGAYASFGPGRGTTADWFSQPRPVYGTAFPNYGALESQIIDSGQSGMVWPTITTTAQIAAGTGITLFIAASDDLAALSSPAWTQVGAVGNGTVAQSISGVSGRYARYRVVLWRDATTEASPALEEISLRWTEMDDGIANLDTTGATGTRKEVTPTTVRMGEAVTYTIVLSNSGGVAVTAQVTDTLVVSATLLSATPGYVQSGQTLTWSGITVPANGTAALTITVRAAGGPLPDGYTLNNTAIIGAHDGEITRAALPVAVRPWQAFLPITQNPGP